MPFFIAETPRAGDFGHCFIVPPGPGPTAACVEDFCRVATQHDTGANFVAARRPVEQRLDTGTVRTGVEILLLVGVDYPQLTAAQQQRLAVILHKRLADLERLIKHIAWAQERQGLRVTRQEFADWVQADQLAEFPLAQVCDRPLLEAPPVEPQPPPEPPGTVADGRESTQRWWQRSFTRASLIVVVLLGGIIAARGPAFLRQFRPAEKPSPQLPCSAPTLESFTQALQALAVACNQPYEGFVSAVHRATLPHKTSIADVDQKRQELCQDLRVWEVVVEQYYRSAKIKPYAFINDPHIIAALQDLLSDASPDIEAILAVRRHVAELGKVFADLHTTLVKWGIDKLPHNGRFAEVIRYVRSLQCAACEHIEPIFPFLAPSDEEVVGVFHDLFLKEGTPLRDALPAQTYAKLYGPERSLRAVLNALATYTPQIRREVQAEKDRAEDASQDNDTRGQRTQAYKSLMHFFDRLGTTQALPPVSPSRSQ